MCNGIIVGWWQGEYGPSEELECQVRAQSVRKEFCEMSLSSRQKPGNIGLGRLIDREQVSSC